MSQDKQKSIAAMRTFARDLDRERGETDPAEDTHTTPESEAKGVPSNKKDDGTHHAAAPKPVTPPPKTETTVSAIPAFHEIAKATKSAEPTPVLKAASSKKQPGITASKAVGGGTIITDTKIAKKSFVVALQESLSAWLKNLKKQLKPKPKRTYSVTSTERRKGVVQKATSKTGAMFSADKAELQEIIRRRQREAGQKEDLPHEPEIEWSPFTEPGFLLLDGEHEKIIASAKPIPPPISSVVVTQKKSSRLTDFVPPAPTVAVVPDVLLKPVPPAVTAPKLPTPPSAPPVPPPAPPVPVVPLVETAVASDEELDEIEPGVLSDEDVEEIETFPWWSLNHLYNLSTNEMTMLAVGGLIVVVIGGYVGVTVFSATTQPETAPAVIEVRSVTSAPLVAVITNSDANLAINLAANVISPAELYFTSTSSIEHPGSALLRELVSSNGVTFAQSAEIIRIIIDADGARALLVKVGDSINARGGLLEWEETLYRDLAPLLSTTPAIPLTANFTDSTVAGVDVRQLENDTTSVLVYGFADDSMVIIASDVATFQGALNILTK